MTEPRDHKPKPFPTPSEISNARRDLLKHILKDELATEPRETSVEELRRAAHAWITDIRAIGGMLIGISYKTEEADKAIDAIANRLAAAEKDNHRLHHHISGESQQLCDEITTLEKALAAETKAREAAHKERDHWVDGLAEWKTEAIEQRITREKAEREVEAYKLALQSIEKNSCCAPCREAGLVARAALRSGDSPGKEEAK